ncbi:MAG: glycogen debranching enzyme family protein, partial [Bacteroidales bacterium]|nr:glycogen debranching enzyme family protein [Bacteroidales bacterium]
ASTITYRVGGMKFSKTIMFLRDTEEVLVKYTLLEAHSPTTLRIKPFLAYRNIHSLTSANTSANTRYTAVDNGVAFNMYEGFPTLNLQLNKKNDWIASPDWYKGVVYKEESRRGFACKEDLFVPGYFELPIKAGESIILSASTGEAVPAKSLKTRFEKEVLKRDNTRSNYDACLKLAAGQFLIKHAGEYGVCSGYSWDYESLRESFIALPGLTLYNDGDTERFEKVIDSTIRRHKDAMLQESDCPDSGLWFIRAIQQYIDYGADAVSVWKKYGKWLVEIIESFLNNSRASVRLHENGLLWAQKYGVALTWMNTYVDGRPVSERPGYQVEVNALWYNALCFVRDLDLRFGKGKLVQKTDNIIGKIRENYTRIFWCAERNHLADYVDEYGQNVFTRPNQLMACAVKYSPLDDETKMAVLTAVKKELLTVRGIRSLSPKNPLYRGVYEGDQGSRDIAHFNGCAFPWLLTPYIEANLALTGKSFVKKAKEMLEAFEEDMVIHGIGSVAEIYDGDPAYRPHGCISSAISVAEIVRGKSILNRIKK